MGSAVPKAQSSAAGDSGASAVQADASLLTQAASTEPAVPAAPKLAVSTAKAQRPAKQMNRATLDLLFTKKAKGSGGGTGHDTLKATKR